MTVAPLPQHAAAPFFARLRHVLGCYYKDLPQLDIHEFLLEPVPDLGRNGRVLVKEDQGASEIFLGIQFGQNLHDALMAPHSASLELHTLGVLAEETSHFLMLTDAASQNTQLSLLELETLGEIDKFLVFMHWNDLLDLPYGNLNISFKNLQQICNLQFEGPRFSAQTHSRYFAAEQLAFEHLRKAFARVWDCTRVDFTQVPEDARCYLSNLRTKMLSQKVLFSLNQAS